MSMGLNELLERKALLAARCDVERRVVELTVEEIEDSTTWVDAGYSIASLLAPKVKLLLPVLALVAGSRFAGGSKIAGFLAKVVAGVQMANKIRGVIRSLNLGSLISR